MELSTTSILSLFETNKEQRASFVNQAIERLQDGEISPLKLHMQVKCMEQLLDDMKNRPEYEELLMEEAVKNGKKFEMYNCEFQVKEAGTKWDYAQTGDDKIAELMKTEATVKQDIKDRQKFLQTIPASGVADPDTGNMIYPASKSSTTIVQVTLK